MPSRAPLEPTPRSAPIASLRLDQRAASVERDPGAGDEASRAKPPDTRPGTATAKGSGWGGAAAALLLLTVFAPASAVASSVPFTGTLSVQLSSNLPVIGSIGPVSGAGTASLTPGGSFTVPAGAFATNTSSSPGIPTGAAPNTIYVLNRSLQGASEAGSFQAGSGPAGGFGGVMGLDFVVAEELGIVPLTLVFATAEIYMAPIGGGLYFGSNLPFCLVGPCLTVTFANGWTTGAISIAPTSEPGSVLLATGFDHRTASGLGHIQLVTPFLVFDSSGNSLGILAGIATLDLQFLPEPGVAMLLALGAWAAIRFGARRSR